MRLRNGFTVSIVEKIGKPAMTEELADLDQDAETPMDEVYQDELEGTGHISDADAGADAATLENLISMRLLKSIYQLMMLCNMGGSGREQGIHIDIFLDTSILR